MPTPALSLHEALEVRNKDTVRNDNPNAQGKNDAPQRTSPQQDGGLLYVSGRCLRPPRKEVWRRRRRRLRAFSQQLGWISTALPAAEHPQGLQEGRLAGWGVLKLRRSPGRCLHAIPAACEDLMHTWPSQPASAETKRVPQEAVRAWGRAQSTTEPPVSSTGRAERKASLFHPHP